ncbi:MAG TPA: AAA family ATPase, partial [Candidatus Limnocylindrales bacterium]
MTKTQSRYVCQACGDSFLRWEGQCRSCSAWNTLVETLVREATPASHHRVAPAAGAGPVSLADLSEADVIRIPVGMGELDRVLGGGLVPGSLVLVGGEPGIGKSTLLLQAAAGLSAVGPVLYATGEESAAQVRLRAVRLGLLDGAAGAAVTVYPESSVERVVETARVARPVALIVDSIQTATVDELEGPAGSVG